MYEHVFWDFDGTLFDTYPTMASAFYHTLKVYGVNEPLSKIMECMKVSMSHAIQIYKDKYNVDENFLERYNKFRKQEEQDNCKPFPYIEDICKCVCLNGGKNYLYTHRGQTAIDFLKAYQLYDYFCDFITSEHGFARKPSPDALEFLIEKHHINKDKAIMIGDRELDVLSGKNAGIDACLFTENEQGKTVADYLITDFSKLNSILF